MADKVRAALQALRSSVFPGNAAQAMFEHQSALAQSQWFSSAKLEQLQLKQLRSLVRFAARETEFWPSRVDPERIDRARDLRAALDALPILSRADLNAHRTGLNPRTLPAGQIRAGEISSSGSTGVPVHVTSTNLSFQWHQILTLRTYLWAGVDFSGRLAVIRAGARGRASYPGPNQRPGWAPHTVIPFPTGPSFELDTKGSLEQQWEWLKRVQPDYLVTMPTIVRGLSRCAGKDPESCVPLARILTTGEVVDPELRTLADDALAAPLFDRYGSQETGCMAIQCPDGEGYHVQSEVVIVEVLGEDDMPCRAGEIGRVVVTPLFNYGTVLMRYDLGDYAELGAACPCGRGLPLVKRIMGRRRNLLVTPDGRHYWPAMKHLDFSRVVPSRERQVRQVAVDALEVWIAVDGSVTPEQEDELRRITAATLPAQYKIGFKFVSEFPRSPSGKLEEFVSLLNAAV